MITNPLIKRMYNDQERLQTIVNHAMQCGVASAISVWIKSGDVEYSEHRGMMSGFIPINDESLYDLASLTKIVGTAPAVAHALALGIMDLNEEPFPFWPKVSIKSLLAHTSGLAAHVKFYENPALNHKDFSNNAAIIYDDLFRQKPYAKTYERHLYSDLNFLALGYLLEQRFKKPLKTIFSESLAKIIRSHEREECRFYFCPSSSLELKNSVPTDAVERNVVHDQNCRALGGLAAHAGLFGSLKSLRIFAHVLARCYRHPSNAVEEHLSYFTKHFLAFHRSSPKGSTRALSPYAFGHFGFTGTSLWIDPINAAAEPLSVVLLTNRVYLNPKNASGIFHLRERIHSLAKSLVRV